MSLQKPSTPWKLIKYQDLHSLMDRQNHQTEPAVQQGADLTYAATTSQSCVTKYRAQTAIPRDSSHPSPCRERVAFKKEGISLYCPWELKSQIGSSCPKTTIAKDYTLVLNSDLHMKIVRHHWHHLGDHMDLIGHGDSHCRIGMALHCYSGHRHHFHDHLHHHD